MSSVAKRSRRVSAPYSISIERPLFPPSHHESGDNGYYSEEEVYHGDSPKDWWYRILTGQDATSELVGKRLYVSQAAAHFSATGLMSTAEGERWVFQGKQPPAWPGTIYPDVAPLEKAANTAANAVLNSYKSQVATFRGFDFAAEFLEVIGLFTSPLKGIFGASLGLAKTVGRAKGVAFTKPQLYAQKVSSAYLGFQFAVKPLAEDLASAGAAIQELLETKAKIRSISGFGDSEEQLESPSYQNAFGCGDMAVYERQVLKKSEVRYKGKVALNLGSVGGMLGNMGFSAPDVIPAVWEAVPLSFLIEYFTNISDVLYRGSTASASPWVRYISRGIRNTYKVEHSSIRENPDSSNVAGGFYKVNNASGGSSKAHLVTVHRSSGVELPPVTLSFQTPSVGQLFNVAALVTAVNASKPAKQF